MIAAQAHPSTLISATILMKKFLIMAFVSSSLFIMFTIPFSGVTVSTIIVVSESQVQAVSDQLHTSVLLRRVMHNPPAIVKDANPQREARSLFKHFCPF